MNSQNNPLKNIVVVMVLLNALTIPLMLSTVNVALRTIALDLSLDAVAISWIQMSYLMASAMFVLIFGRLADMFGRKRIFLLGAMGILITSILAACTTHSDWLISARFAQGVCAAMLYATQIAIISSVIPPQQRGKAIGLTVSVIYIGLALGPLIGGFLVEEFGWRISFLIHLPITVVVLYIGWFHVKGDWFAESKASFDVFGAFIYSTSILLLCLGAVQILELEYAALFVLGLFGLIGFFYSQHNNPAPIFNVDLMLKNRIFLCSCLTSLLVYTSTFANIVLVSLYLQYIKGMQPSQTGTIIMIQPLVMAILSPIFGSFSDRIEPRVIASLGIFICGVGLFLLSQLTQDTSLSYLISGLIIIALGFSIFSSPNINAIMTSVSKSLYGNANSVLATMRILGQMGSITLITLMISLFIGHTPIGESNYEALEYTVQYMFGIATLLCIPALFLSLIRGKYHQH